MRLIWSKRIGRYICAIGVIQHVGILVPTQQDVPIGIGHGTQVQTGCVQVDGMGVEGGRWYRDRSYIVADKVANYVNR